MKPAGPGVKLTYDDYVLFPEDGMRHELIDGVHYVTPAPNHQHQHVLGELFGSIWSHLKAHPIGRVYVAPFDVLFSRFDVVEPDILYMSNATAARVITPLNVQGVPDLVVEITSPSTKKRDATIKYELYQGSGVAEYWIVEPETAVFRIHRNESGRFGAAIELSRDADDVLTTPLLPGFALPLARLFQDL